MKSKDKILDLLMHSSDYISGEKLSQVLGISRNAIWKNINRLKQEGYQIDSVTNKGYRIIKTPVQLSESQLMHELKEYGFTHVQLDETLDSTNLEAKRKAESISGHACFIAREQTLGRGRRGRYWNSPKDQGCYLSLLLRLQIMPSDASMITLIAGLALAKTLNQLYDINVKIKWPNDLVVGGKKIAGILTEMSAEIDYLNYLVVGVGVNVSQAVFSEELKNLATSLAIELKQADFKFDRHAYVKSFIEKLMQSLEIFYTTRDLSYLKKEYEAFCLNVKGDIRVEMPTGSFCGRGQGITDHGQLRVLNEHGETIEVNSGEVSVRGIYGYI